MLAMLFLPLQSGLAAPASALRMNLAWRVGERTVVFDESVSRAGSGFTASVSSDAGELDSLVLDEERSTLEWSRAFESERTRIEAIRQGAFVRVSGVFKGKPYDRTHDFGALPWYQFQELSYGNLHDTGAIEAAFWTIDRSTLRASLFRARRGGIVSVDVAGTSARAVEWKLTIDGVASWLFESRFWLRESDGRFLRLEVPAILGLPKSVVELTGEIGGKEAL
jgi:hypothetical protein